MELVNCKKCGGNELEAKGAFLVCTFCQSKFKRDASQGLVNCGTCGLSDKTSSVGALRAKTSSGFLQPPARPAKPMVVKRTWHWVLVVFLWIVVIDFVGILFGVIFANDELFETNQSTFGIWGSVITFAIAAAASFWGIRRLKSSRAGWNTEAAEKLAAFEIADKNWRAACQRLSEARYCERCHVLFDEKLSASVDGFKNKIFTV